MSTHKVIDFRVRPPYKSYLNFFANPNATNEMLGLDFPVTASETEKSVDLLIKELDAAGVEVAVIPGREWAGTKNADIIEVAQKYPERFVVFPYLDALGGANALTQIDEYLKLDVVKGFALEPTWQPGQVDFDDERIFPIYKKLEENNIPVMLTFSAAVIPTVSAKYIEQIEQLAIHFPRLSIILAHGAWPFTTEAIAVAFRHKNVYLVPDAYGLQGPAGDDYIRGANTLIPNQLVYGSSYPVLPIEEGVRAYGNRGFKNDAVREKFFYRNAAKLLGLE